MERVKQMINKLKRKLKSFYLYYTQILKAPNDFNIERKKSIKMKLNGFTPEQYILYGFDKGNNPKDYINEIERWNTREVNGYYKNVLDDKLLFYEMFHKYIDIPQNLFWIKNRKILDMNGNLLTKEQIAKIIKNTEIIFIKPVIGGGGRGVYKVSYKENFLLNNKQIEFEEIKISVNSLRLDNVVAEILKTSRKIAQDFIEQEKVIINYIDN